MTLPTLPHTPRTEMPPPRTAPSLLRSVGRALLALCATLLAGGCASIDEAGMPPAEQKSKDVAARKLEVKDHAVVAHKSGLPIKAEIVKGKVVFGETMDEEVHRTYLAPMMDGIAAHKAGPDGRKHILIFIHGGMNGKKDAVLRSMRLADDVGIKKDYYPISIDWDSGPFSSYWEHLTKVRRGSIHQLEAALTWPVLLTTDVARGFARAPMLWERQVRTAMELPGGPFYPSNRVLAAQEILKARHRAGRGGAEISDTTLIEGDQRDGWQTNVPLFHYPFFPSKMVTGVLIDILGTGAWDIMLRRSELLFRVQTRREDLSPEARRLMDRVAGHVKKETNQEEPGRSEIAEVERTLNNKREASLAHGAAYLSRTQPGAVELFLKELEDKLGKNPGERYSITLVGHSMGTIVANQILSSHAKLPFDEIVYLAAACSVTDCVRDVGTYLELNRRAKFYNLSLHPIAEVVETNPTIPTRKATPMAVLKGGAGLLVPRGSLLVWLDEMFTKPMTPQGRRMGMWRAAVTEVNLFPKTVQGRVHLKMFASGPEDQPQKHGSFVAQDMEFWSKEYRQPDKYKERKP